jgi:predicted permease
MLGLVVAWLPTSFPRVEGIAIDTPVLLVTAAALVLTAGAAGAWPALQIARWDVATALRDSLRGASSTARGSGMRDALVIAQLAVAVLLSISAILLVRSFVGITSVDPGFSSERVVTMQLALPRSKYPDDWQVTTFYRNVLNQLSAQPGIDAAGMVNRLPLGGVAQIGSLELDRSALPDNRLASVDWRTATPAYLHALAIPLLSGRAFTDADSADAPLVGLVDERLARIAWPNESPLGRRFRIPVEDQPWVTIVGVVGHIRHDGLTTDPRPQVYWSYQQRVQDRMALVVRSEHDADVVARLAAAAVHAVDPDQPVYDVRTMAAVIDRSLGRERVTTAVLAGFAIVALLMAAIGGYGVVSYGVGQRGREFSLRMALGAERHDVLMVVLGRGGVLIGWGLLVGIAGAMVATRALKTLLFQVSPMDWISFAVAAGVLGTTALIATLPPALRAVASAPAAILRGE